jgi:cytoskeleton protein RodZ
MSEETENIPDDQAGEDSDDPRCGERLAEARREQQISVVEVAKELHLDEHKVRALERNEFEVLGAPVFAKGHLRKYSQLVGVDEADVFADYYAMTRADGMPPIVARRKKIRHEMSPGPWIAAVVVIVVAAAAYWWFAIRVDDSISIPVQTQDAQQSEPEPQDEPVAELVDEPENLPAAPADQIRLALEFSGECWTEVTDADGRQLFGSLGSAGQTVELSGKAPLRVLFGNADNVEVRVDDNSYSLPAPNSANRTVRTTILKQ